MQKLVSFMFLVHMLWLPAAAVAGRANICDGATVLKLIYSKSSRDQTVENPAAIVAILKQLEQDISENLNASLPSDLFRAARNLAKVNAGVKQSLTDQSNYVGTAGPALFWALRGSLGDLTVVSKVFGCRPALGQNSLAKIPPVGQSHITLGQRLSNMTNLLATKLVYAWVPILAAAAIFAALFFAKRRRAEVRKICNIHLHVVYGQECTVTRIFDLSQSGMKIEAAAKDTKKKWLDFHFGGQKIEGKIAWRSPLYAGVVFRKRLSKETLDAIMTTSNKPINESGIEKTTTGCFHEGCHVDCPLHIPTALSLRSRRKTAQKAAL